MARSTSLKIGPFSTRFLAAWHALEAREARKINATELAGILGVSPGLITQWMDPGTNVPPQARVLTIARECGVDPGWLAFGEATVAPPPQAAATPGRGITGTLGGIPASREGPPGAAAKRKKDAG